ncbi:RcnB family protein [Sphingomonas panacisoli]|uniref:RcnB family protein n=1 Tax=Sphingomonas panacisoli TaxID=1813879 RepID=A0A5B8LFI6_9SPHN|nr:RcnB family protein [Sphingomonas panacisoli]QDZ07018.1 RcnB family protein [Sphingomonas panacisoli]
MRSLVIAAVVATMAFGGTAADAQRLGPQGQRPMPMPNPKPVPPMPKPGGWQGNMPRPNPAPMPRPNRGGWNGQWNGGNRGQWNGRSRWGSRVGGYWWAGVQAPGGWNGYTRMKRGKRLPGYWVSPNYIISDWQMYGLGTPPSGYYWSRYYNDAVLIDQYGTVYDTIGSVDWDRNQGGYAYDQDDAGGYADYPPQAGYPAPQPRPGYGAPYPAPGYGGSSSSTTTYTYTTGGGYAGGYPAGPMPRIPYGETYYVSPGSVVTVTMPGAVTTTTTTTEYIEERSYVAPKRVYRKVVRKWRPRAKPRCSCVRAPAPIRGS